MCEPVRRLFTLALLGTLTGCSLPPYIAPCGCEHPGLADLSEDQLLEMLDATVEKGTYEYRYIKKQIKHGLTPDPEYFGHTRYDLGYADGQIWVVPDTPVQGCPFEVHWQG
jgi:hypothetical protein